MVECGFVFGAFLDAEAVLRPDDRHGDAQRPLDGKRPADGGDVLLDRTGAIDDQAGAAQRRPEGGVLEGHILADPSHVPDRPWTFRGGNIGADAPVADRQIGGFAGLCGQPIEVGLGGGSEPVVSLTGPQTVLAGESVVYTLHVQSTALTLQTAAGLDVSATGGTLASLGGDTQVMDGEVTQTSPKNNTGAGMATFSFGWTAPMSAPQTVVLYAAGNSVNLDGTPGGDHHANTILSVDVVDPSAVELTSLATTTPTPSAARAVAVVLLVGLVGLGVAWRRRAQPLR